MPESEADASRATSPGGEATKKRRLLDPEPTTWKDGPHDASAELLEVCFGAMMAVLSSFAAQCAEQHAHA